MMIFVCYYANALVEIKQEMHTIKLKLQHWTSRPEHVIMHVCILGMQVCRLRIVICIRFMYMSFDVMVTFMIDVG